MNINNRLIYLLLLDINDNTIFSFNSIFMFNIHKDNNNSFIKFF